MTSLITVMVIPTSSLGSVTLEGKIEMEIICMKEMEDALPFSISGESMDCTVPNSQSELNLSPST